MVDAGREREAIEAVLDLGDSDPQDPLVVSSREALGRRLEALRRRRNLDGLARSVEEAIRSSDGSRAVALFEDLQRAGRGDTVEQRLRPRVDSIRQAERTAAVFDEGLTAARQALARKDLVSGRAALQRALAARPGNVMARKLLSDVEAAPPPVPIVERRVAPDNRVGERVRELLVSGVAAYRAGEYESALARWHQALELDPDNVQARRYIDNVGKKQERLR
jgi:tetratricopeptide (TPR) repeat protein